MRSWIVPVLALLMTACSDAPTETKAKAKAPEAPAAPHTGKEAFYKTYPVARTWASDCQPVRIRSYNLKQVPSADGKAGAWEVTFASLTKGRAKTVSWSAVEAEGLHVGVFAGHEESWSATMAKPFPVQALVADTPAVFETAKTHGAAYFQAARRASSGDLSPRTDQPIPQSGLARVLGRFRIGRGVYRLRRRDHWRISAEELSRSRRAGRRKRAPG
jgi:hypothetical protein